jgi:hypothetical protein
MVRFSFLSDHYAPTAMIGAVADCAMSDEHQAVLAQDTLIEAASPMSQRTWNTLPHDEFGYFYVAPRRIDGVNLM